MSFPRPDFFGPPRQPFLNYSVTDQWAVNRSEGQ
jgi:hypothetical protein